MGKMNGAGNISISLGDRGVLLTRFSANNRFGYLPQEFQ